MNHKILFDCIRPISIADSNWLECTIARLHDGNLRCTIKACSNLLKVDSTLDSVCLRNLAFRMTDQKVPSRVIMERQRIRWSVGTDCWQDSQSSVSCTDRQNRGKTGKSDQGT